MNKLMAVALAVLIPTLALAGGTLVSSYTSSAAAGRPVSSTLGVPLVNEKTGEPVKAIAVSIVDYADGGGADDEYGAVIAANAWIYSPQNKLPDGGGGWSRAPTLDVSTTFSGADVTLGSVTASRGATVYFPAPTVGGSLAALGGNGARLYYQVDSFTNIDGGSAPALVRTTIEARY